MIRRLLLYALALVPLVVVTHFAFPFITGKAIYFRVLVDISAAAWAYGILRSGLTIRFSPILAALAALVAVMGLATILSPHPVMAFWSGLERMDGYVTLLHLFALFIVAGAVLRKERDWRWFWDCFLGAGLIVTGFGCFQLYMGWSLYAQGMRFDSSFGAPIYLGTFALWHAGVAAWRIAQKASFRWLYWAVLPIDALALYSSGARAALLGSIAGIAVTVFLWRQGKARVVIASVLIAASVALAGLGAVSGNRLAARISDVAHGTDVSANIHLAIWEQAITGIKDRPWLGWGPEGQISVDAAHQDPRVDVGGMRADRAHDIFLDWLVAGGVIGLTAYLALWAAALNAVTRLAGAERAIIAGLLAAYFVGLLFEFDNLTSYIPFVMMLGWLHYRTAGAYRTFRLPALDWVSAGALALGCGVWLLSAVNSQAVIASRVMLLKMLPPHH